MSEWKKKTWANNHLKHFLAFALMEFSVRHLSKLKMLHLSDWAATWVIKIWFYDNWYQTLREVSIIMKFWHRPSFARCTNFSAAQSNLWSGRMSGDIARSRFWMRLCTKGPIEPILDLETLQFTIDSRTATSQSLHPTCHAAPSRWESCSTQTELQSTQASSLRTSRQVCNRNKCESAISCPSTGWRIRLRI